MVIKKLAAELPKHSDLGKKASETFDPDKRIDYSPMRDRETPAGERGFDPDHRVEYQAEGEKTQKGGRYQDLKDAGHGEATGEEVHHMPADSATELRREDGPSIVMDKSDHRQTASCGNSKEAQEYRNAQKDLINDGKFRDALQMDIDDIHEKFGDKYDGAIAEVVKYVDQLEQNSMV